MKNLIVGQSGGPTAVINGSLYGVVTEGLKSTQEIGKVYGMVHGIEGFLGGQYMDMDTDMTKDELSALKTTPGAFLGSCRYKLPEDLSDPVYPELFKKFEELNIGYFFYCGGNDSMDTVSKLSRYAASVNSDIRVMGVPKTIDNDLVLTDHTPGFGSAAKFVASSVREINRDSEAYDKPNVMIIEIMGRHAGWLAGAASLAGVAGYPADLVYLPEVDFNMDEFLEDVKKIWDANKNVIVAVSEGIHYADGKFVSEAETSATDGFGHAQLGGLAVKLGDVVKNAIPGVKVRPIELSLLQRCAEHCASQTDSDESFMAGQTAVNEAIRGTTDKMVGFKCTRDENGYRCEADLLDLSRVANFEKKVPVEWINERGNNVSDEFVKYALPLIQGEIQMKKENSLPRFVKLKKVVAK